MLFFLVLHSFSKIFVFFRHNFQLHLSIFLFFKKLIFISFKNSDLSQILFFLFKCIFNCLLSLLNLCIFLALNSQNFCLKFLLSHDNFFLMLLIKCFNLCLMSLFYHNDSMIILFHHILYSFITFFFDLFKLFFKLMDLFWVFQLELRNSLLWKIFVVLLSLSEKSLFLFFIFIHCLSVVCFPLFNLFTMLRLFCLYLIFQFFNSLLVIQFWQQLELSKIFIKSFHFKLFIRQLSLDFCKLLRVNIICFHQLYSILVLVQVEMLRNCNLMTI